MFCRFINQLTDLFCRIRTALRQLANFRRNNRKNPSLFTGPGSSRRGGKQGLSYCKYGRWQTNKSVWQSVSRFTLYPKNSMSLGRFKLCINSFRIDGREMAQTEVIPTDEPDANGEMNWLASNQTQYASYYMGITCFH